MVKRSKKAFRKKQEENKNKEEIRQMKKLNEIYSVNKRKFYKKVGYLRNEHVEPLVDIDVTRNEIFKLFNETEVKNLTLEKLAQNTNDEFIYRRRQTL
ncbi:hypothetical protein BpHYR1_002658 [Brachionus plicatilis]|uniref:Uncharacterized protein n=1 Tax=Brachionus plicatilis TaxID=10195 RepID=A0A3M7RM55_BRAPC|nr:hypothetical protein BpHYR1_002658 [Brachionus plicatilis]